MPLRSQIVGPKRGSAVGGVCSPSSLCPPPPSSAARDLARLLRQLPPEQERLAVEMTPADADAKVVAKRRGGNNYIGREPAAAPGCDAAARLLLEALRKSLPSCDVRSRAEKILTSEIALSSSFSSDRTGVVVARTSWKSRPAKKQQTPPAKGKGGELEALAAAIYRAFCYEGRKQQQRHSRHTGDEGDSDFIESQQRLERGYYPTNFRCAEKDATSDITGRGKTDASAETEKQHRGQLGLQKEIGDRCEGAIWRAATSANSPLPAPPCMGVGKTIHNQCQVTPGASVARGEEEEEHERSLSPPPFSLLEFSTADAGPESGPQKQTPPLVSDSDESSAAATNASLSSSSSDGRQVGAGAAYCGDLSPTSLWGSFMECVKLNVVATTATNKGIGGSSRPAATSHDKMGKKKRKEAVYEVYRLAGPAAGVPPVCHDGDVGALRTKIQDEFLALFDGCMEGGGASGKTTTTRLARKTRLLMRDCRVHAIWCHPRQQLQKSPQETRTASRERQQESQKNLWIQVNIGPSGYSCKKGVSTSAGAEFTAIVTPGSDCVAIGAMTAPGAPAVSSSRSRLLTPIVLSALESAVTSTESDSYSDIDVFSRKVDGLSGVDPYDLLLAARSAQGQQGVVGRFAHYSSRAKKSDPISDLRNAATRPFVALQKDRKGAAAMSSKGIGDGGGIVDRSAGNREHRKRDREAAFGRDGDCPRMNQLRWEIKGETRAASECWLGDNDHEEHDVKGRAGANAASVKAVADTDKFKCRVVLQGSDVFAGLQALLDAGFATGPLPSYLRDAPGLGGTIRVENGAIVSSSNNMGSEKDSGGRT